MTSVEPSVLALFWAGVIAFAIVVYVILDGFVLGVGMLFGTTREASFRSDMMTTIAPVWDGNQTWLVVVGASLLAAFPVVYAVFLPAFYIPMLLLLLGLIFRGVAFEFRHRSSTHGLWDRGFFIGSAIVAFVQGAAVGAMIRGIPVANGHYAGGSFDWLAPLPVLTGVGLMLGYALLGAGWLVLKSEGTLRDWARRRIPRLAGAVLVVLGLAAVAALVERDRIRTDLFGTRVWGMVFPLIGLLAMAGVVVSTRRQRDGWPFAMTVLFFFASFLSLAVMFWPYMVPYSITVGNAAAPEASLAFLFWGGAIVLPVIVVYTAVVYWIFRGKILKVHELEASAPAPSTTSRSGTSLAELHHIIIVGGGAGGIELATRLGDKLGKKGRARITLVEKSRTHIWKPLLYEIAAGSMDVGHHELDYLAQGHWHGFQFRYGEMTGIDRAERQVHLAATFDDEGRQITPKRSFTYDTLVVAVGSVGNDFGTPGVMRHAIMLDTPEQAQRFNRRLINACVRAYAQPEPIRPGQLHVTVIGAGATGTELAAELHSTARSFIAFGLEKIDPDKDIKISLVEAADRILPPLPERIARATADILQNLGVEIRTKSHVAEVTAEGVKLASGELIPSELVVWAAGVKGPDVLGKLDGLEVSRSHQLVIKPTLQTTRDDNIFALGDCAYLVLDGQSRPIPPRAQAAHQQASHLVGQLQRRMRGEPLRPYVYRDFGTLVSLGESSTVGSLMGFASGRGVFVEGLFARLMYRSLSKMHEMALHGPAKVGLDTFASLLTRRTEPHVKLH
jgi:NADH:ubiquinone reductase (H+-translocating)